MVVAQLCNDRINDELYEKTKYTFMFFETKEEFEVDREGCIREYYAWRYNRITK